MTSSTEKPGSGPADAPRIPSPPSQEDIDQVSSDQALITDEWAPDAPPATSRPTKPAS